MKKLITLLTCLLFLGVSAQAQTARVQVIHNSPDAAANMVDVWLTSMGSSVKLVDDFTFRTATPFIDAPAGMAIKIGVAPMNSTVVTDTIANFDLTLTSGETYVVVANGIVSAMGYSPSPAFDLDIYPMGREMASTSGNTDVLVAHGSTDAPVVDVFEVSAVMGPIVEDLNYGSFDGYLELGTADYELQIRDGSGTTPLLQYSAPLSTLGLTDSALVVVASGFLDPSANSNGPAFGLYAALPAGGPLVMLPTSTLSTARVQVIHNSADAAADTVDVWLDNTLLLDDFAFRNASPFIDAPAGTAFDVRIQPKTSTDTTNPIAKYTYNLVGGEKYILIANGIVSASGYSPATPFNLDVFTGARESSVTAGNVNLLVYHGSTDAPTVDVFETSVPAGTIVDDISYSEFQGYLDLGTLDYELDVRDMSGATTVASFSAPLNTLGLADQALTVLASGFLDPGSNSNGAGFGLYAALPTGGELVALPVITSIDRDLAAEIGLVAYPVPANQSLNLRFNAEEAGQASVRVMNFLGQDLIRKDFGFLSPGSNDLNINLNGLPNGTYLYELSIGETTVTAKFMVAK